MTPPFDAPGRIGSRIALLTVALLAALATMRTISNSDFWLHLSAGREVATQGIQRTDPLAFTTGGAQWVHATWLYDWAAYRVWHAGGASASILLNALAAALAFGLMARLGTGRVTSTLLGGLLALWLAIPQLVVRPTIPAMALTALTLALLARPVPMKGMLFLLVPLQVVWSNMHASFLLGPVLALLTGLGAAVAERREGRDAGTLPSDRYYMIAAVLLVATLANPYGYQAHVRALHEFLHPTQGWLMEWISPFAGLFEQSGARVLTTITLALTALGFVLHLGRLPILPTALGIASAFLLVRSPSHAEWCALLALPFLMLSFDALIDYLRARLPAPARTPFDLALPLLVALAVACTVVQTTNSGYLRGIGSASRFGLGAERDLFPADAAKFVLGLPGFPRSTYNLPIDGGALRWEQPQRRVFCDARTSVFGPGFFRDFTLAMRGDSNRWEHLSERWPPEAFVFNCCWSGSGSMIRNLLMSGQWSIAYFDGSSAVLLPALRRNLYWLRRKDIQQRGLQDLAEARGRYQAALTAGRHPPNPARLIGAASFLQSIGRFRDAASIYALLVQGSPEMTGAWLNLGICQVQAGRAADAVPVLEYAKERISGNVMVLLWLSRACRETGDSARAEQLQQEADGMNHAVAEAFASAVSQTERVPAASSLLP